MIDSPSARAPAPSAIWLVAGIAMLGLALLLPTGVPFLHVLRSLAIWGLLMVAPGWCLLRLLDAGNRSLLELWVAGLVGSPVLVALTGIATLFAAGSAQAAVVAAFAISSVLLLACVFVRRPPAARLPRYQALVLLIFIAALLLLTATLPFTREWWRIRSDAWFHAAVVAQIRDFGMPPQDPYFLGMPLQYMWFYHVLLLTLSEALRVDSFWSMAIVNVHAVVALVLAGFYFASVVHERFLHRFTAMATLVLAFNAAFWILLPLKFIKAFVGDVRGGEEIARTFALTPLHYDRAYGFMNIYFNQEFFLDKFMVATAFGIALVFMTTAWGAAIDHLRGGSRFSLALLALCVVGMLGFHSLVGFVFLVGAVGGVIALHIFRRHADDYRPRAALAVVVASVLCFLIMTPYLYQVMHAKEREQVFPLDFSFPKIAGILIASAFVMVVALRARTPWRNRTAAWRFLALSTAAVTAFCFSIALPGPNTYDKLGYFVFIPFAIMAGIAIADSIAARSARRRPLVVAAWVVLFFLPVNAIAFVSCFGTPDAVEVTPAENRLSEWVRSNTPRNAVFIDDHDRVPLLVTGPRRYYWGTLAYAEQWGYPKSEMTRRKHVVEALYSPWPRTTVEGDALSEVFRSLAAVKEPLFIVVRPEHRAASALVTHLPLTTVFEGPDVSLVRVDPATFSKLADSIYN